MTITRRATMALAAVSLTLLANTASAEGSNRERIRLFYDTFETGNADLLDQIIAEDWVNVPVNPGQGPGRQGFKDMVPFLSATFANTRITTDQIVEEGNLIAVRSTFTGTQAGPFAGFPSKGRDFSIMTIDIHEFNDQGLVVKTWHLEDWLGGLFQMGAFEQ